METTKTSVVIIGAGPTGLSLAVQLLRYNIDFIIIEKNEKTTRLSKAVVIQARTLEIFQQIGLAEKAIERGRTTTALNMFYKGKRRTAVDLAGLGKDISRFSFALSLEQSKTEELLAEHLSEHGKTIRWASTFSHLEQRQDSVTAYFSDAAGKVHAIEADYLVGCDGASSPVRHQLGLAFEGDTVPKIFYVADVTLESTVINKNELFMFLIKKGFILFFPMQGEGHYRIIGVLPETADPDTKFEFSDIEDSIKEQVEIPLKIKELRWFSSYRVHSRMANGFMKGNCFIAGDAGHIHTPAGGQGMNTGIQDSYNLAWKLAYVITGKADQEILKTYNTERLTNAAHLLSTTDRMFDVMAGTNWLGNFIRLYIFPTFAGLITKSPFARKRIFPLISQTGIAYPDSALTISSSVGKVYAGDRMPYFTLPDSTDIYDQLKAPAFKILFFGNGNNAAAKNQTQTDILEFKEIPDIFGKETDFYILLRPDNHISYIGKDFTKVPEFLNALSKQVHF